MHSSRARNAQPSDLGVLIRPGIWDDARCTRVRAAMDGGRSVPAEIFRDGYIVDEHVRRTLDIEVGETTVREAARMMQNIRHDLAVFSGCALTRTEGPGFLRYLSGGFYRVHRDRGNDDLAGQFPRQISVVMFLTTAGGFANGGCQGGALRLYGPDDCGGPDVRLDILPVAGTLVAFPSTLCHEVLPVTAGVRDVIVDWFC